MPRVNWALQTVAWPFMRLVRENSNMTITTVELSMSNSNNFRQLKNV